jgi:hypothetical protein
MVVSLDELFRTRVVGPATSAVVGRFTRVRYPFADRVIDVAVHNDGKGLGTTVAAPCRALDGFLLKLRHDDRGTRAVLLGDAAFQQTYAIETSDSGLAIDLLDAPTRALIAFTGHVLMPTRKRDRCYSYTIAQGFVSARAHAAEESEEALEDAILAVDALARRPEGLAAAWRRTAAELGAEVRGPTWTVGGDLRVIVPSATGAYTVTIGARTLTDETTQLATKVIDDAHAVIWIDSLTPDPGRIRAAIAKLAASRNRLPYR